MVEIYIYECFQKKDKKSSVLHLRLLLNLLCNLEDNILGLCPDYYHGMETLYGKFLRCIQDGEHVLLTKEVSFIFGQNLFYIASSATSKVPIYRALIEKSSDSSL